MSKPWVYIAGPYTGGDVVVNVRTACLAGLELRRAGFVPIVPHLSHLWHTVEPQGYRFWMELDRDLIERCDCLVRLPGESPGADEEVELATSLGIPVFRDIAVAKRALKAGDIPSRME